MSQTEASAELVAAFNEHFKTTAKPAAVARVLGSPHVREWYAAWRAAQAESAALPAQWEEAGLTAKEWTASLAAKTERSKLRASAQAKLSAAAEKYKAEVEAINLDANLALRAIETPLVLAIEGGYEQLPLAAQLRIEEQTTPDARDAQLAAELKAARKTWVKKARAGKNPFEP